MKTSSGLPLILHYGELHNYFIIYYNVIITEIKCIINVMHLNHPETIPPPPHPWSVEKLSSTKAVPGAKKVGDRWLKGLLCRYEFPNETEKLRQHLFEDRWFSLAALEPGVARNVNTSTSSITAGHCGHSRKRKRKQKTQRKCPGRYWSWSPKRNGKKEWKPGGSWWGKWVGGEAD